MTMCWLVWAAAVQACSTSVSGVSRVSILNVPLVIASASAGSSARMSRVLTEPWPLLTMWRRAARGAAEGIDAGGPSTEPMSIDMSGLPGSSPSVTTATSAAVASSRRCAATASQASSVLAANTHPARALAVPASPLNARWHEANGRSAFAREPGPNAAAMALDRQTTPKTAGSQSLRGRRNYVNSGELGRYTNLRIGRYHRTSVYPPHLRMGGPGPITGPGSSTGTSTDHSPPKSHSTSRFSNATRPAES